MVIEFFPASVRNSAQRQKLAEQAANAGSVTEDYKSFGRDYFDNPELGVGYGGYRYDGRFEGAVKKMIDHYGLKPGDRVLEVGCAKGFVLVEFFKKGMDVAGLDISEYAIANGHPDIQEFLRVGDVSALPFADKSFDFVFSKEMLPHVPEDRIRDAVRECMRVSKGPVFFEIQCGTTEKELEAMMSWDATHKLLLTPSDWDALFAELGYGGDVHYKVLISEEDSSSSL